MAEQKYIRRRAICSTCDGGAPGFGRAGRLVKRIKLLGFIPWRIVIPCPDCDGIGLSKTEFVNVPVSPAPPPPAPKRIVVEHVFRHARGE